MKAFDRLTDGITSHSRIVIVVMLVLTVAIGAGAGGVESSSSLDQFESDSPEAKASDYISQNFTAGDQDTQITQVIVRNQQQDGNVLTKDSLLRSLQYQQELRSNQTINETFIEDNAIVGVSNIVAITAITQEQAGELQARAAELQQRQEQLQQQQEQLNESFAQFEQDRAQVEQRSQTLNQTAELLRAELTELRQNPDADVRTQFEQVTANTSVTLNETQYRTFEQAAEDLRNAQSQSEVEEAYTLGTQGVLRAEFQALQERSQELQQRGQELQQQADQLKQEGQELQEAFKELQADQQALQASGSPSLSEQIDQLESMNESEVDDVLGIVLAESDGENGGSPFAGRALQLMEKNYEPGSTTADARMMIIQQVSQSSSDIQGGGSVADATIDTQLEMQDVAEATSQDNGDEYIVFGFGVISQEIDQSLSDSLAIVGPFALLFVIVTLVVAYRDLLDIVLGLVGIFAVLMWTFGMMGYLDIAFNQIMIAVPVLLIGLSIDYAIHIFMRHREERLDENTPSDVRGSMQYALAGVGIALVWVTATTVIGFLSNLTSPLGPIADFGIVSSWGIVAALAIFGAFIPALKVEADSLLEGWGFDRKKRAFGTGGGRFSQVLKVGSVLAKKAPVVVILVALTLSAAGAYGGSQVSTSFAQEDFIAGEPPEIMYELPEPLKPGEYSAKQNLDYVNDNFQREDSNAQVLIKGGPTDPKTLQALADANRRIDDGAYDTPFAGASGEVNTRSPLTVMAQVAAENESFNRTFTASDTDGDGAPDQNVTGVYDQLFEVAPDQAAGVIHRTDGGSYEAVRLVVPVKGGASTSETTKEMRAIADSVESGAGLADGLVIATGSPVVNEVVQNDLLDTVIQSLVITLVAVFLFLMLAYRITEGSATLGIVTLLPVALSVAWILGTMYLIDMPFNVLTGMITSLTVGLGVAYSIHVSERFNLELGRRDTKWEAMDKTITGTGGALLGSAATTVGGFGVLSVAIFPALQQFGIITALTIIYAFLASVLVLPSLLVVWHRYVGETDDMVQIEEEPEAAPVPAETGKTETDVPAQAATTSPNGGAVDTEQADEEADSAASDDGEWTSLAAADQPATGDEDESAPAGAVPATTPILRGTRTVADETPTPGSEFTASLAIPDAEGRVMLAERVPGTGGEVSELSPRPTSYSMVGRRLYVLWELDEPTDLSLAYFANVPEDAKAGERLEFESTLRTAAGDGTIEGPAELTVMTPFLRETLETPLTKTTLDEASQKAREGKLTRDELEVLYERWLDGEDDAGAEATTGQDGGADFQG
ncbi:MMPL family transporter [Haloarchaeobius amylolyticus]|uniref:MMPL family transporter n=1 Tax=Haloarchaeobius amylolyticus TaxID=1198296 RepID=UPI002271A552|nr:MMPL family transporter [Haloarchaeobius amylolyticus]